MINIVINEEFDGKVNEATLTRAAEMVMTQEEQPDSDLSVVIEGDEQLREMNRVYRGVDAPTDVLSFPADEFDPDTGRVYAGDVIISFQRAGEQAAAAAESLEDEITLLVVHGTLHLLGYDHAEPDEKAEMWAAQQKALDALGCKITHLPE